MPNAVASLRCQENQQNCYIARLIVRLDGKLSSLGCAHPIFCSAHGGAPQKSGGAHQNFSTGASRRHFVPLHFQIASGTTLRVCNRQIWATTKSLDYGEALWNKM